MGYQQKINSTNEQIRQAFLNLLTTKSIGEITVNDIASAANVHRGTFYRHYVDKYELLEQIENDFMNEIDEITGQLIIPSMDFDLVQNNLLGYITHLFIAVDHNLTTLQSLMSDNGDQSFKSKLKNHLSNRIHNSLSDKKSITTNLDIAIEFISAMDVSVIEYYIDHPDKDVKVVQTIFLSLLVDGPLKVLMQK